MIVVSLGANLDLGPGGARSTLDAALSALDSGETRLLGRSGWFRTAPVPPSGQPDYINGTALLETGMDPWGLVARLHRIEAGFGRLRRERWGARTLDLDLVGYHGFVTFNGWRGGHPGPLVPDRLCLPHPRAHERAFVLRPLLEMAPEWRHPVFGLTAAELLEGLVAAQRCERL